MAWIGDDIVIHTWEQWRQEGYRPAGLHLDPNGYALNAGWELRAGQRHEVISPIAYELVPSRDVSPGEIAGPVTTTETHEESCRWCTRPLTKLFDIDLRDPRMAALLPNDGERLSIVCCDACTPMQTIFMEIDLHGASRWSIHNPEHGGCLPSDEGFGFPPRALILGQRSPTPLHVYRKQLHGGGISHIGGYPIWVQDFSNHPKCPTCSYHMHFIGQADVEDMLDSEGIFYGFVCLDCGLSTCVYEQT